jgi:hypothetical protein
MASGFIQRFKGKITTFPGGIFQGGVASQATFINSGAPTNGTSGTLANVAPPGSRLVNTATGTEYANLGTLASPTWTAVSGSLGGQVSVANPVTAVGSTRASAALISSSISVVATAASGTGVQVLAASALGIGASQTIYNNTANAIKVYAAGSDTIDTVAGSTGVTLSGTAAARFTVLAATAFQSNLLGLKSA